MVDILIFGAHPDDAEFGMGGSIIKFLHQKKTVAFCVLTQGENSTLGKPQERVLEMQRAAAKLKVPLEILDLMDCRIFDNYDNRVILAKIIRKYKPRIVFAPYHTNHSSHKDGASHPDHTATGVLVRNAARYARFGGIRDLQDEPWCTDHLLYYILPRHIRPTLMIDVTEYMPKWEELLRIYASQIKLKNNGMISYLQQIRQWYGFLSGVSYAEGFLIEEPFLFDIDFLLADGSSTVQKQPLEQSTTGFEDPI